MIASSSPPPPKVTLNPAGDFSVVVSPSSPELTTTPHTPGAAGDPNARDYKAPLADRPYSEIVDPRLCLTDATGSSTPFTRQAEAALTSNAEVKCILASGNAKRIKSVLRMNHWTSTHMVTTPPRPAPFISLFVYVIVFSNPFICRLYHLHLSSSLFLSPHIYISNIISTFS